MDHKNYFMSVMGQQMRLVSGEKIEIYRKILECSQKQIEELKGLK